MNAQSGMPPHVRERAKHVIAEIIRQSPGDELDGSVRLFKAFYFAHLYYAISENGYLTEWPIVKMPNGPGIDNFDSLICELEKEGQVQIRPIRIGPYPSTRYRYVASVEKPQLSEGEAEAVRQSVEFVAGKSGAQLSDITHDFSRSWNEAQLGEELPIYLDLLPPKEYDAAIQRSNELVKELELVWSE
jgi:hypothetical protein